MSLTEQANRLFNAFQDEKCRAWARYHADWRSNWKDRENYPIPLLEDYCEIFHSFG